MLRVAFGAGTQYPARGHIRPPRHAMQVPESLPGGQGTSLQAKQVRPECWLKLTLCTHGASTPVRSLVLQSSCLNRPPPPPPPPLPPPPVVDGASVTSQVPPPVHIGSRGSSDGYSAPSKYPAAQVQPVRLALEDWPRGQCRHGSPCRGL